MKKNIKNKKGVALVLVLASIVVLTTFAVELSYSTNVSYRLAQNDLNRLQADYLAKSALNFMLLELKFDRMFRQIVESQNLGQYLGESANLPLCQQFPMSTGLIRAVFTGGGLAALTGGSETAESSEDVSEPSPEQEKIEEKQKDVSISQEKTAEEFLDFEGDFEAECIDEGTKINLNGFAGLSLTPAAESETSPFEQYKQFLFWFLSEKQFELLFKDADIKITDVVDNIGDWIDVNTEVNGMGGKTGGGEKMAYDKLGVTYPVRNGKLLSLLEAYLINDVIDDWFAPLIDYFTVYGDGKINVCNAKSEVVEGLIRRYVASTPGLPPLRLEDREEMGRLTGAVAKGCSSGGSGEQLKTAISGELSSAIGAVAGGTNPAVPMPPGQTPQPTAPTGGQSQGFASYLDTQGRFFSLNLTGQVKDIIVRTKAVIDVRDTDPKKWKFMYWRVY